MSETKSEKFVRIMPGRVTKALDALRLVEQTFNRSGYEWTPEQAEKIEQALVDACGRISASATVALQKETPSFSL